MKRIALLVGVLTLATLSVAGCASGPSREDRIEATSAYLELSETSESIADAMAAGGVYDGIAEDLVKLCDDGRTGATAHTYASAFDGQPIADAIIEAWQVACPD